MLLAVVAIAANAATIETDNGSRLVGVINKIHDGVVYLKPDFSDEIKVPLSRIVSMESDEPISLRSESGEVQTGTLRSPQAGAVTVTAPTGSLNAPISNVASAWQPGARDPIVVAEQAAIQSEIRRWKYQAGADLSGRSGNSDSFSTALHFRATLVGPIDRLEFYGSYNYTDTNGVRSADEVKAGTRFTSFFSDKMGWFIRSEMERDTFEGIDFRSTSAGGLSYRFIRQPRMEVEGSAGLSYRYESYMVGGSEKFPGLDFGVRFVWQFAEWGRWTTLASFVPSIDNFNDFLLEQDSGLDIPLGRSDFWTLRAGLNHKYNNRPDAGRRSLDTLYYLRLILNWN